MFNKFAVLLSASLLFASTAFADIPDVAVTKFASQSAVERLCYVKANEPKVTYRVEAKRYGLNTTQLKKIESQAVCGGIILGAVKNKWGT